MNACLPPLREIRATFTEETVTVYQAYRQEIADAALQAGRFAPPFKMDRMTWIKPSFLWMMYRCGWGLKDGQERILAVHLHRDGFEKALARSCFSHFDTDFHPTHEAWKADLARTEVRLQWDPERDLHHQPLPWRSLQLGISGTSVREYVNEWTHHIQDVTDLTHEIHAHVRTGDLAAASALLPEEQPYPLPPQIAAHIGIQT